MIPLSHMTSTTTSALTQAQGQIQAILLAGTQKNNRHHTPSPFVILLVRKGYHPWSDVLMVFPHANYLQHKTKAPPFLKGANFKTPVFLPFFSAKARGGGREEIDVRVCAFVTQGSIDDQNNSGV